mmetsp:Transcript_4781/g.13518  ORF Transcript_4781/g.13518 Transcript_4781/m.13518 type:complete len:879 (-) Transcript_4781:282-2918(-)
MPKESSLHSRVSFPNDNDLWLNNDHFAVVFPQSMSYRVQPGSNVIALGNESNLRHIHIFQRANTKQSARHCRIRRSSDPQVHVHSVVEQENTVAGEPLDAEIGNLRQQDVVPSSCLGLPTVGIGGKAGGGIHVVNRKQLGVDISERLLNRHVAQQLMRLDSLIGMDIGTTSQSHILHHRKCVQGQELEIVRDRLLLGIVIGLLALLWWHGVSRYRPLIAVLGTSDNVYTNLLKSTAGIVKIRLDGHRECLLGQNVAHGILIDRLNKVRCERRRPKGLSHDANLSLSILAGVQQSRLERNRRTADALLIVNDINGVHRIRRNIGKGKQIGSANEKVAIEIANAHASGTTDAADSFECSVHCQILFELALKFRPVHRGVERDVSSDRTSSISGQLRRRRNVNVLEGEEVHVDTDLSPAELDGSVLVPLSIQTQQLHLVGSAHHARIFSRFESTVAKGGQDRLEHTHLATDVFRYGKRRLQGRTEAGHGTLVLSKHFGQVVQKVFDDVPGIAKIHKQIVRCWNEQLLEVTDDHHLGTGQAWLEAVVVHRVVKGDEPNVGSGLPGQIVKAGLDGGRNALEHATADGRNGNVDDEKVRRRLRGADHVLGRGDEFNDALVKLGTLHLVPALTVLVEVAEVGRGTFVELGANVASPAATIFEPCNEGVDVRPATLAPDDPGGTGLDYINFLVVWSGRGQGTDHSAHGNFAGGSQRRRGGDAIGGKPKEPIGYLDGVVDPLLKDGAALLLLNSRLHSRLLLHSGSTHHTGLLHSGLLHSRLLHSRLLHSRLLHLHASRTRRGRSALHLLRSGRLLAVETTAGVGRRCGYSTRRSRRRRRTSTGRGRLHHMGLAGRGGRTTHAAAGGLLGREGLERGGGVGGWRTGR